MNSTGVVGYTFQADIVCPACMRYVAAFRNEANGRNAEFVPLEALLQRWAKDSGWDIDDESSYDSGDFPKVVLDSHLETNEQCGSCGEWLL